MSEKEEIKVLVIGDPHFRISNTREMREFNDKIAKLARERTPDLIVCLGDILDTHERISMIPLMDATKFLREMSIVAPTILLIGNHDMRFNTAFLTGEHAFNAMKYWTNMTIVDTTTEIKLKGHTLIGVPYTPPGRFNEALSKITDISKLENNINNITCVFAHQEFRGAKMGAIQSQIGDVWSLNNPLVISGHIHDYDELQPNLYYIGTPLQHSFGDQEKKTVSIFKFLPSGSFEQERIDLNLIRRVVARLDTSQILTYTPPDNAMVKIIVKGTPTEIKALVKNNCIKDLTKRGVKIAYKHVPETTSSDTTSSDTTSSNIISSEVENGETRVITNDRQISYLERLYHAVKNDPIQVQMYNRIFGKFNPYPILTIVQPPKKN